jgi:hypothetical protein
MDGAQDLKPGGFNLWVNYIQLVYSPPTMFRVKHRGRIVAAHVDLSESECLKPGNHISGFKG